MTRAAAASRSPRSAAGRGRRSCCARCARRGAARIGRRGVRRASPTRRCARRCARQEEAGVDLVTDGEQRRDNFYSFVADKLDGVRLMTLAEMLDWSRTRTASSSLLETLDVPAFAIRNPTCVGRDRAGASRSPRDDLRSCARHTDRADQGHAARAVPADARDVGAGG